MAIKTNWGILEKKILGKLNRINKGIESAIRYENYGLAESLTLAKKNTEKFYIESGLKYKNFNGFKDYLDMILGYYDKWNHYLQEYKKG